MAPLPLHGQVRPIKVEQEAEQLWPQPGHHHEENTPSNLNSTPPILRRRGRKRDAEDEKLDQVMMNNIPINEKRQNELDIELNHSKAWKSLGCEIQNKCANALPFTPSKVEDCLTLLGRMNDQPWLLHLTA